jgi:SAM-dependent methyltransferase
VAAAAIATARQRTAGLGASIPFRVADLYGLDPERDGAELVVCCEVLEHLPDPGRALDILAGLARPHLIASVPREPLWRLLNLARGRYWRDLGNTPGHLQHWSSARFAEMLGSRLEVVEVRKPLPWAMALCRAR